MEITSIKIKTTKSKEGALLGVASIQLDNCLVIHNLKILNVKGKRIIGFPNRKITKFEIKDGECIEVYEYADIVHPCTADFRKYIETEIFKYYDKMISAENGNREENKEEVKD